MKSLLSTKELGKRELEHLLAKAQGFRKGSQKSIPKTVALVFTEASTRTSLSFQMAAQMLGMNCLSFSVESSSLKKGETLLDTLQTLEAIGVDATIIRTSEDWPSLNVDQETSMSLINAGSGHFEHPTQALLDAFTIKQYFADLNGLKVTIVGDVLHSRVARSNIDVLRKLGAVVSFSGPEEFADHSIEGVEWIDFDQAIQESDVIMMLRIQHERHSQGLSLSKEEYHNQYGLTLDRVQKMKPESIIMHPGPVNRDVEIADEVMSHPKSKILEQVKNGVYMRMAILELCLAGGSYGQLVSA